MHVFDLLKELEPGKMLQCIEVVSEYADNMSMEDETSYNEMMKDLHVIINGKHFDEFTARDVVSKLSYTDKLGKKLNGPYWTLDQIKQSTSPMSFPSDTTDWDKYVAFNVMYSDLCKSFDDAQIIKAANLFFFHDEDWSENGSGEKIWCYINSR